MTAEFYARAEVRAFPQLVWLARGRARVDMRA
jgi:hypothetical protein